MSDYDGGVITNEPEEEDLDDGWYPGIDDDEDD
jgi:hypothetical protein